MPASPKLPTRSLVEVDKHLKSLREVTVDRVRPPPEEDLGGGDICSLEEKPPTEDDKPLD